MSNKLWVAGGASPNPGGRPKGSKRNFKTTIDRFFVLNITLKELQANYNNLKLGKERVDMLKILMPYHIAPIQNDSISHDEISQLYDLLKQAANNETKTSKAS